MRPKFQKEWLLYGAAVAALVFSTTSITKSQPKIERTEPAGLINPSPFVSSIAATGSVEPASETITVAPDVDGVVREVHVAPGDRVKAGTPLFSLDNRRQFAAIQKATAQLEKAHAEVALRQAEANSAEARTEIARIAAARLHTTAERYAPLQTESISAEEFDRISADAEKAALDFRASRQAAQSAAAAVNAAKANIALAQADLADAQASMARTVMRSPIAGDVLNVSVRIGEPVRASDQSPSSVSVGDLSALYVRVEIDEAAAAQFDPVAEAKAYVRGAADAPIGLEFVAADAMLRPKQNFRDRSVEYSDARMLQVRYRLTPNSNRRLYVGQLLDIYIGDKAAAPAAGQDGGSKGAATAINTAIKEPPSEDPERDSGLRP